MIGIIYKFTVLARYKMNGHKPFYVGQRWERKSVDKFLSRNCSNYNGSGSIWNDFLDRLKKDYPKNWRKLVKREVLYVSEMVNQKGLDVLEEYYIKKCKAHYSYKQGGCNILWGSSFGRGKESPTKDPLVRKKMRENHADFKGKNNPFYGDHRFAGENNPFYGKKHSKENRKRQSEIMKEYYRNHINPMKGKHRVITDSQKVKQSKTMSQTIWITNGIDNTRININLDIPNGWRRGRTGYKMKKK